MNMDNRNTGIDIETVGNENLQETLPPVSEKTIHPGFPSPAADYMTMSIDLNRELVRHPAATFYGRAVGDSMSDAGVEEGDILVIDRALEPREGDLAVCFIDGGFVLRHLHFTEGGLELVPANDRYPRIPVGEGSDFVMWGVVTYLIKKTR